MKSTWVIKQLNKLGKKVIKLFNRNNSTDDDFFNHPYAIL
jgi:hypothetical protein